MEAYSHSSKPVKLQPSEDASCLSKLFFCWALPLFYNYNKDIKEEYYAPLKSHTSGHLGERLENAWNHEFSTNEKDSSLWYVLWKIFHLEFLALGILFIISEFILKMSQPWLIGKLMHHYDVSNSTSVSETETYIYGSLILMTSFFSVLLSHFYLLKIQHLGMKIRVACCSLIYRKTLKITKSLESESNVGKTVNLLTNDVNRFDLAAMHLVQLIVAPVETIVVIYCMHSIVGVTSIAGIIFLLLFIPAQMYMGKLTSSYRLKTAEKTDQRVKLMDEIVRGVQVIKMYTWENFFARKVSNARKSEIHQIMKAYVIRGLNVSFQLFMNRTGIFLCIVLYAVTQREMDAKYVFVVSSFYAILRQTLTVYLPFGIQNFCETKVSVERIRNFLIIDEVTEEPSNKIITIYVSSGGGDEQLIRSGTHGVGDELEVSGVHLENVSVKWASSPTYTLNNITLEASNDELVVITGSVGSGKSTLMYTILKELPLSQGKLNVKGTISYVPQEPWLFSGTVRQNILFGSDYESGKYKKIVEICELQKDFLDFPEGDSSLVGERGSLLSGGQKARVSLARALYKNADIYLLDDPFASVDAKVAKKIYEKCLLGYLKGKCVILVTHQIHFLESANKTIYTIEKGLLSNKVYTKNESCDTKVIDEEDSILSSIDTNKKIKIEEKKINFTSKQLYKKYARAGGGHWVHLLLCLLFVLAQGAASGADYFVAFWANLKQTIETKTTFSNEICIYIYVGIIIATIIFSITRSMTFFSFCMKASTKIHNQMFSRIIRSPMKFFNATSSGSILNRFSKDIGVIDETIPLILMDTLQIALIVLGSTLLITLLNHWMLFPTVAIFILFYFFKTRFMPKSRNLKRLEATARSPIYSHMNASLQGLTTIRTFKVEHILKKEFDHFQDLYSSAFYMSLTCMRAFGFWLDMNCVCYSTAAIVTIMLMDTRAGNIGLGITQSMNLIGVLQWGIRQWSELENQMISIERVMEYTNILSETDSECKILKNWPSHGQIIFESVSLKYSESFILDGISFSIKAKEKIGIVGRTGAGKSSLISALFRLFDFEGRILIDDVNITEISLSSLRSKISIISQEPVLFSGSLRENLDPNKELDDSILHEVLKQVNLTSAVTKLDDEVVSAGSNFSVGERQLICLARAILRNNKILILDEATANIDSQTDHLIQETIKKNFQNCTILTVAHRLRTIMKSDKILVVDAGKIKEFDHAFCLLKNSEGLFSELVGECGVEETRILKDIARQDYEAKRLVA